MPAPASETPFSGYIRTSMEAYYYLEVGARHASPLLISRNHQSLYATILRPVNGLRLEEKIKKVTVIGSGNVGATAAILIAKEELADVVLLDIAEGIPQGKALDMFQAMPLLDSPVLIGGTNEYADIAGSDVVVVTAGLPRQPGMSRLDLLHKNATILTSVIDQLTTYAPETILLIVTNPLDIMTYLAYKKSGFPSQRILGMGGLLDSARMRSFLSLISGRPVMETEAMVIGAHGDEMVPLLSQAKIGGQRADTLLSPEELQAVADGTKMGGAAIVELLKTGSAFYAPGAAIFKMIKAILRDEKEIISACCLAEGVYGIDGIYINLPAIIGSGGVEKIVELDITDAETEALKQSAASIEAIIKSLDI